MKQVVISTEASERLKGFFPWVYDNEILRCPKNITPGEIIYVHSPTGMFLGVGYLNLQSKIAVRILSFEDEPVDSFFFADRIRKADSLRGRIKKETNSYRVVHSEADALPGLIIDFYDGFLSVQINTLGMESQRDSLISAIKEVLQPRGIYEKSDSYSREKEGLTSEEKVLFGQIPERILVNEKEVLFQVSFQESQKTGFYLDQRRNRKVVSDYVQTGDVILDVFCNTGGFGIHAGLKGADVRLVDISQPALNAALQNIKLNNINSVEVARADAFDYLLSAVSKGDRYNLIVLDPPSFAKTKQARRGALQGFKRILSSGLSLLKPDGYLAVFSCSYHITIDDLLAIAQECAVSLGLRLRILEHLFQDLDHPYLINIPQSLYLKGLMIQKD